VTTDQIEFTDRYDALGIPRPSLLTVCLGDCEGTGVYPDKFQDTGDFDADWRFVTCEDCAGTGRQRGNVVVLFVRNLPRILRSKWKFARQCVFSTQTWRRDVPHPALFNLRLALRILFTTW
jgi:hypothetical protein